ncbi:translocation/assembly module TamB domain-containing protein [Novosphingobium lentum]|uniref:translocation/assembly module TamB domain-containing protein n=1 Tax=Novosphingobium lentum TaxID=145287 RepID=UPI0009FEF012|nr:translocation/assembly module TamB domain-containing protein [Novosphingobium lentum]
MADTAAVDFGGPADAPPPPPPPPPPPRRRGSRTLRWGRRGLLGVLLALLALMGAAVLLDSSLGHRFVIDRIAALTPGSGLRIQIGRIEGSLFGESKLHDITLSDPQGKFLTVPDAELDWRPFSWLKRGLDIRSLALHRGHLLRAPKMRPGDPSSPVLPNFDIRIDKLVIDNLTVEKGVMGERRRVDLAAKADIRKGRALLDVNGKLGGGDKLVLHLDSEPDRDKFDLALDYAAPRGGLLASLAGAQSSVRMIAAGKGGWHNWQGWAWVSQDAKPLAAFLLGNRAGRYNAMGQAYPDGLLSGTAAKLIGPKLSLAFDGTMVNSVVEGKLDAVGAGFRANSGGALDLGNNAARGLVIKALVTRGDLLMASPRIDGLQIAATLDGPFRNLSIDHQIAARQLTVGTTIAQGLRTAGVAHWDGARLAFPLALTAQSVHTGNAQFDPRFAGARVTGNLLLAGNDLSSDNLAMDLKGLAARLALRGNLARGGYALAGPVAARGFALTNLGAVDADARILFRIGAGVPWTLQADASGRMVRVDNATLQSLTGGNIRFTGAVSLGETAPLLFRNTRLSSQKLALAIDGQRTADGRTTLHGNGRSLDYGPFTIQAAVGSNGPTADLVFASPYPAAGLADVRVALAPIADGFRIEAKGGSRLGPFEGTIGLFSSPNGPTRLAIERFKVWQTDVTGTLLLGKAGVAGNLALNGGGLDGTIRIDPHGGGGQAIAALITAHNARFGGPTPLSIGNARLEVNGTLLKGRSTIDGSVYAEGVGSGQMFLGRLAARVQLVDGSGTITASVAGRRGTRFALQGTGTVSPDRVVMLANGNYAGRKITMPRRAVLTRDGAGWRLAPTQIGFGRGIVIASGHVLGGPTEISLQMADMPLSVGDILVSDLGLGGNASGLVDYRNDGHGAPTGSAKLQIKGLTRSGLVLTSRPLDVFLVADLGTDALEARAVMQEGGAVRGRLQGRIGGLPRGGTVLERLRSGSLVAQLRYNGPADALWRLTSIEVFDLTGTLGVAADVTGSLDNPELRGTLASKDLRLQSALTGTDLTNLAMTGSFTGSRLTLPRFAGTTPGGGQVVGSGTVDLSNVATQGVALDLRLAATNARLLNRDDMGATVTGPLRLISNGTGGTIAGRLKIDAARWMLGRASTAADLPDIPTREINAPADIAPQRIKAEPWRFLIDASGGNRVAVRGLGLDSEWGADIRLRGDTTNPQIFGTADLVRGGYEFAGKRFELSRGRIRFAGEVPPDPLLDIAAEGDVTGLSARITIGGTAARPIITFSSTPALPEEEVLSRLLFGSSITQISAPEALQLASALASLRGGGGLDPINKLRSAIGLDRLRIVGADATTGAGTSIAVGKYLGRRFFVELVTDGKGYSATSIEFRITRWLSLLATVSTIGNNGVNLKASKDY